MADSELPTPQAISKWIRAKVADLNDDLLLAYAVEVDVEFIIGRVEGSDALELRVWCSQEVR